MSWGVYKWGERRFGQVDGITHVPLNLFGGPLWGSRRWGQPLVATTGGEGSAKIGITANGNAVAGSFSAGSATIGISANGQAEIALFSEGTANIGITAGGGGIIDYDGEGSAKIGITAGGTGGIVLSAGGSANIGITASGFGFVGDTDAGRRDVRGRFIDATIAPRLDDQLIGVRVVTESIRGRISI